MKSSSSMEQNQSSSSATSGKTVSSDKMSNKVSENQQINRRSLRDKLYYASKDGFSLTLCVTLNNLDEKLRNRILNEVFVTDDEQSFTPLVLAAKYGRFKVVRMLLKNFNVQLEKECDISFDGHIVAGVNALWAAAGSGHLNIVKLLIEHGANVNHCTKTNSTPLRAACYEGRLDVAEYLVAHGADINFANNYNNTCLMIASYKGHSQVVEFLLKQGADVNVQAKCGATALHYAAETGQVSICQMLLEHGSALLLNEYKMSPVISAAEKVRENVVELFSTWPNLLTKQEQINAWELMGASFANDKDNYSLSKSYNYLMMGMELRYSDEDDIVRKELKPPVDAYQNWVESQTKLDLQGIQFNHNSLHMESLTIRERILGQKCPELVHPIIFRGAVCADNGRFDRCEALWLHAMKVRQNMQISVQRDLLRFAQVFSQIIQLKELLRFENILTVLEYCVIEIESNKYRLEHPGPKDDLFFLMEENELNTITALYLLTISTKCFKMTEMNIGKNDLTRLYRLVLKINKLDLRLRDGQTLLHLAVNGVTPVDDFHTSDVCRFPCVETVKLLLQCGHNVDVFDYGSNSPLHTLLATLQTVRATEEELLELVQEIIRLFHHYNMHFDAVNCEGLKPALLCGSSNVEQMIRGVELREMSLKCLAARTIAQFHITFKGGVPVDLEAFVQLHTATKL